MRRLVALVLLMTASVLNAQDQPTAKQCRANLKTWVPMFKAAYDDPACKGDGSPSCPFAPAIRSLNVVQLIHLPFEGLNVSILIRQLVEKLMEETEGRKQ